MLGAEQTTKEAYGLKRLVDQIALDLESPLRVYCDSLQTIRIGGGRLEYEIGQSEAFLATGNGVLRCHWHNAMEDLVYLSHCRY